MENSEEKKYPLTGVSAFIYNDKKELLLIKAPRWLGKYTVPGGKIEIGETIIEALKREVKEETNLDIKDINLLAIIDGVNLDGTNINGYKHAIFLDHTAMCADQNNLKLNEEGEEYKWLTIEKWLEYKEEKFAPYIYENLLRIKEKGLENDFDYKYKRALADYQNLLKQTAKEKEAFAQFAQEQFLFQILPVYDNLKMAVAYADKKEHDAWHEGVKHVLKQFLNILQDMGVEEIKTENEKFDHNLMEAVENKLTEDENKDGMIAGEIKAGYRLNGKVIIPARVIVYKYEK